MLKVFISSTTKDLQEFREFTDRFVRGLDLVPVAMEDWPPDGLSAMEAITERLGDSDLYVGILAWRYGETIPVPKLDEPITRRDVKNISYTEFEYCLAEKRGLRRLVFMTKPEGRWLVPQVDVNRGEVEEFRKAVGGDVVVCYFEDLKDFCLQFSRSLVGVLRKSDGYKGLSASDKALLEIANLISQDLTARRGEVSEGRPREKRTWFVREIGRCNLGRRYIGRCAAERQFASWLVHHRAPFFLLVGASGLGKTNFVVDQIRYFVESKSDPAAGTAAVQQRGHRFRPVVFFPLGLYDPKDGLAENVCAYVATHATSFPAVALEALGAEFESLVRSGNILLVLDGLDELARQKSESACRRLLEHLGKMVGSDSTVVITCRDHIYRRLRRAGLFAQQFEVAQLTALDDGELDRALDDRGIDRSHVAYDLLFDPSSALRGLAKHPLLLELLLQVPYASWRRLSDDAKPARVYDLWFAETARLMSPDRTLNLAEMAHRVARLMLENRSDVLKTATLKKAGLPVAELRKASEDRLSVFVRQTKDEWGFVHDSFREYSLAKTVDEELRSREYEMLAEQCSLDYVGSETFRFVSELLPPDEQLLESVLAATGGDLRDRRKQWNNMVQNCCEAVGMMVVEGVEPYVEHLLSLLVDDSQLLFNQTKYNLVRCLERLHDSAERPYWRYVMGMQLRTPDERCFGVSAVRGFHRSRPRLGYAMDMELLKRRNESAPEQLPVSEVLVSLLESSAGSDEPNGGLVEVNCSMALIRWLHKDHVARLWELGDRVCPETRGNLFHACRRMRDCEELLAGHCEFFRGMYLYFVGRELARPPISDCRIEDVTFFESTSWKPRFKRPAFPNGRTEKLGHYKPSYPYTCET